MDAQRRQSSQIARIKRYRFVTMVIWTTIIVFLASVTLYSNYQSVVDTALIDARTTYNKDILYRRWASLQGGVYVPISEYTQPNPYLDVPHRDVTTTDGQELTLVNPAYMTRQVHELAREAYGIHGHITSLNPLRPENMPDDWERAALEAFERGEVEVSSVAQYEGQRALRYMQPMYVEETCLKCHQQQGYELGEVRGGLSVAVPLAPYGEARIASDRGMMLGYGLLWLMGMIGIGYSADRFLKNTVLELEASELLRDSNNRYQALYDGSMNAVYLHDFRGNFVDANDAALAMFGYPRDEIHNLTFETLIHPNDLAMVNANMEDVLIAGQHATPITYRIRRRDGQVVHIETMASVIRHADKKPLVQGIARDVTEQKNGEDQLRFLNQTAIDLMHLTDETHIYDYLGAQLHQIVNQQAIVVVNRITPDGSAFIIEGVHGLNETQLGKIASLMGVSPIGKSFVSDPIVTSVFERGDLVKYPGGLAEMAKRALPQLIVRQVERFFNIDDVYLLGIRKGENFYAGVQLYMRRGAKLHYVQTIETFVNQVSTALYRVRAEETLRQSEERMRALLSAIPDLMFRNDRDGTYLDYHAPDGAQLLIASDQIIGRKTQDIMPEILARQHLEHIERTLTTGEQQNYEYEMPIQGETHIYEARMVAANDDEVLTIVRDVTENRQTQRALAESEAHLQSILNSQNMMILRTDMAGVYTYVNDAMHAKFAWMYPTVEDMLGTDSMVTIIEDDHNKTYEAVMDCIANPGKPIQVELRKPAEGGGFFWGFWEFVALEDADGQPMGIQCSGVDITERKLAQQHAFELALEQERHQLLATFIRDAAHEFRTPLSTISTSTHLMLRSQDETRRQKKAEQITQQINRMTRLVDMLLLMSKLESDASIKLMPINLRTIIADQCRVYSEEYDCQHVLTVDLPQNLPRASGDASYLTELVHQLLDNACRYTSLGGTVTVTAGADEHHVWFEVCDTGIGIAEADLPHIFDTFWRQDDMHRKPGFGLGLPIVKRIVERHRGIIDVESIQGQGSSFRVTLDIVPESATLS